MREADDVAAHIALPPDAEHFLVQLATRPPAEWLHGATAYERALADARVALAAAALRRAIELADASDAAVAREVERRVDRMTTAIAVAASDAAPLGDAELARMRKAAVAAVGAVALRALLKPLDVALLVAPFRGGTLSELA